MRTVTVCIVEYEGCDVRLALELFVNSIEVVS